MCRRENISRRKNTHSVFYWSDYLPGYTNAMHLCCFSLQRNIVDRVVLTSLGELYKKKKTGKRG